MIVLSEGERWYKEQSKEVVPMDLKTFESFHETGSYYDQATMTQVKESTLSVCYSYEPVSTAIICVPYHSFLFVITRRIPTKDNQDIIIGWKLSDSKLVYLTIDEIRELYTDPKSIWEESQKWVGDAND